MKKVFNFFRNADTEKTTLYSGVALLVVLLITQLTCNKKTECVQTDWSDIKVEYQDSINALASTYSVIENNPQPTDTIVKERVVYKEHTTFVKNWNDLQDLKAQYNTLREEYNRALSSLDLTQEQLDSALNAGGPMIVTVEAPSTEPAVIRTEKNEKTDEYEIKESILSRGPLVNFSRQIKVYPKTVTVTKKEVEYLKKNKFIALQVGAMYLDDFDNIFYTPSLAYSGGWWMIEAAPVLDHTNKFNFDYRGLEAKAGIVHRFK